MGAFAGPSSRKIVREGKAMIHSSRRDRRAKAIAEVLAMIADAHRPLAPHRPRNRRTKAMKSAATREQVYTFPRQQSTLDIPRPAPQR